MSKFKVGDIVSPNVDYYWSPHWQKSEVIGFDHVGTKIKNTEGVAGHIAVDSQWKVEETEPKFKVDDRITWGTKAFSGIVKTIDQKFDKVTFEADSWLDVDRGTSWGSPDEYHLLSQIEETVEVLKEVAVSKPNIEVKSKWTDGEFIVTVVYVSEGEAASVFYVHDDGSGTGQYIENFVDDWKPYKEPKTITRWTYVYRDECGETLMDCELYDTEKEAIDGLRLDTFGCGTLIRTLKVEYTEE
jgi:hypothetical protein